MLFGTPLFLTVFLPAAVLAHAAPMPDVAQSAGKRLLSTIRGAKAAEWSGSMSETRLPSKEYSA